MNWPSSTMATKWPIGGDGYKTIAASIAMSLWVCWSVLALGSYMRIYDLLATGLLFRAPVREFFSLKSSLSLCVLSIW